MQAPATESSTREEREEFIRENYRCRSDCDSCGYCRVFHGEDPEHVFAEYIEGEREYPDILREYR